MSTITERLLSRLESWLDHLVEPDTRYVCGACDDRFHTRLQGVEHLLRFHPEFQGVVVYESDDAGATVEDWRPTWTNRTAGASLWNAEDARPVGVRLTA